MKPDSLKRPVPPPRSEHRQELEDSLLRRFDALVPQPVRRPAHRLRYLAPALVLVSLLTASRVPAEYGVEVGKRVTLVLPAGVRPPPGLGERLAEAMRSEGGRVLNVSVQARRSPEGPTSLVVDVWGDRLAEDEEVLARVRGLEGVEALSPRVERLEGRVRDNLLGKIGHRLFRVGASAEDREQARQRLIAQLRNQEGPDAQIEVELEPGEPGRVRVKVKRQQ